MDQNIHKDTYNVNKCCSLEVSINQRILKKIIKNVSTKILGSTTVFNIDDTKTF